jgi:hypothetical protein
MEKGIIDAKIYEVVFHVLYSYIKDPKTKKGVVIASQDGVFGSLVSSTFLFM